MCLISFLASSLNGKDAVDSDELIAENLGKFTSISDTKDAKILVQPFAVLSFAAGGLKQTKMPSVCHLSLSTCPPGLSPFLYSLGLVWKACISKRPSMHYQLVINGRSIR